MSDTKLNLELAKLASPRDWPEDYFLENGCYINLCTQCDYCFLGLKGRVTCRQCVPKNYRKDSSMSDHLAGSLVVAMFMFMIGSAYKFNEVSDLSWWWVLMVPVLVALATFICLRVGRKKGW